MPEERDLRDYARTTQARLLLGVILLVFLLGDGLVFVLYGAEVGWMATLCSALGLLPVIILFAVLYLLGWVVGRVRDE